ncbi:Z1 domain-containing protein [Rouxiella chamberiensis]|uniref:Z1 domain-containing protein n=1 Tax=Rouxiella chamberiensis TaxID=1513468 RepID=UPI0005D37859|nr:Z1 domain-containing protein [Rouxiella chamberiensis]
MKTIDREGFFYTEFRKSNVTFSQDTFTCAEETISSLLNTSTTSEHPGMLLGKVQSGKTRTFISILALAFDNSFDFAIVLTKNSKALTQQTYKRLRKDFEMFVDDHELEIYDIMSAPKSFGKFELDSKMIFIAKKQDDNLRNLIDLFQNHPQMAEKRVLIIDDEADSASIGYSKEGDVIKANKIASKISELRSLISKVSFLQVTATPYSLYLQPTEVEVSNVLEFKPTRPAFTKLVPVPAEYVGGDTYFGELSSRNDETLESLIYHRVDHREFDRLKKQDGRAFKLENALESPKIKGYRTALITFIVGGCILSIKGVIAKINAKKLRYSFLLHSEAGRDSHDWQEKLTVELVSQLKKSAEDGSDIFHKLIKTSYDDLYQSLILDHKPVPTLDEVCTAVLKALNDDHITITKVNSEENVINMLDDTGQLKLRSPLNVFLGGQVLDRGITLANLIGFYYGRRPQKFQQDTVLQHSRMYGYRRAELAVTRFYTSQSIHATMKQMEEFDSTLREAIETGGDKTVQFIRKAKDGTIVPCSPNKILVSTTQTLRPFKRILPIGFQTGYRTGANGIEKVIEKIDSEVEKLIGFNADEPVLISLQEGQDLLSQIETTLIFEDEEDAHPFNWEGARAALAHLSAQNTQKDQRGKIWLWAANGRNSARLASMTSHAKFIETPDSEKTEGKLAKAYAIDHPILFLLRQEGKAKNEWRDTPFYWPIIRAQANTPTAIFASETID